MWINWFKNNTMIKVYHKTSFKMELMTKKVPNLVLKYSCSATPKILHCGATRISWALKFMIFKPNSLMISIFVWLITCVKGCDMCFIRNDHANRRGSWRERDRGNQQLGLSVSWQVEVWAEFHGKEVLHIYITKLEEKWNKDISLKSGTCSYRGDLGLSQLQRRFRAFSSR